MVDYYRIAKKASLDSKNHPAIKYLKNLALKSKRNMQARAKFASGDWTE